MRTADRKKWVKEKILDFDCKRVTFLVTVLRILRLAQMVKSLLFTLLSAVNSIAVAQAFIRRFLIPETIVISHIKCMQCLGLEKSAMGHLSLRSIRFTSVSIVPPKLQLDL
jgi:hypothetical protein